MKRIYALLQKWDYERHEYGPFLSPAGREVMLIGNIDSICRCAECGKRIRFDDSFASIRIHDPIGFGYAVCSDCYQKEWEERKKWIAREQ